MSRGKTKQDRNQVIADRRIEAALYSTSNDHDVMQAVRELIQEAYNRGMSAGQMRERVKGSERHGYPWD